MPLAVNKYILIVCCLLTIQFGKAQQYVFYLHGKIVENQGAKAIDTVNGYGAYLYSDILDSLKQGNNVVLSEVRAKNTDVATYAQKIKKQIDSILTLGVKPELITVIGASKGALIAMKVSTLAKNSALNFVLMAGCYGDGKDSDLEMYGNILSIYESSDLAGSCDSYIKASKHVNHYKELKLATGLRHGFLYKAIPEWIEPSLQWAKADYR